MGHCAQGRAFRCPGVMDLCLGRAEEVWWCWRIGVWTTEHRARAFPARMATQPPGTAEGKGKDRHGNFARFH